MISYSGFCGNFNGVVSLAGYYMPIFNYTTVKSNAKQECIILIYGIFSLSIESNLFLKIG